MRKTVLSCSLLLILTALFSLPTCASEKQQPYYGFFRSELGQNFKKLTHNIFGFSIDIPSTWVFGVHGTPPLAVVLIYPEGMNTAQLSSDYEMIEIGRLPFNGIDLNDAQRLTLKGMTVKHPNLAVLTEPNKHILNGKLAVSFVFQWPSRTGLMVTEYVTLVQAEGSIRSLAVRSTRSDIVARRNFYDLLLGTFSPFNPIY